VRPSGDDTDLKLDRNHHSMESPSLQPRQRRLSGTSSVSSLDWGLQNQCSSVSRRLIPFKSVLTKVQCPQATVSRDTDHVIFQLRLFPLRHYPKRGEHRSGTKLPLRLDLVRQQLQLHQNLAWRLLYRHRDAVTSYSSQYHRLVRCHERLSIRL